MLVCRHLYPMKSVHTLVPREAHNTISSRKVVSHKLEKNTHVISTAFHVPMQHPIDTPPFVHVGPSVAHYTFMVPKLQGQTGRNNNQWDQKWTGLQWHVMACHGMSWHALACHGMLWHAMAYHGMP